MKKLFFIGCIFFISIQFFSCDLFQLKIQPRDNTKDPGSANPAFYVVSVSPADGDVDVETDAVITVTFSEDVDPTTVTSSALTVTADGVIVAGTLTTKDEKVTFTATENLTAEKDYTITLSAAITSVRGTALEEDVAGTFSTRNRRWETPVLLENYNAGDAEIPQIAIDADGNAIVV